MRKTKNMANYKLARISILLVGAIIILSLLIAPIFLWVACRIDLAPGTFAVLIKKTGKDPAPGSIVSQADEKGVQLEVLSEGRHFRNPYAWDWKTFPITDIPPGKMGVVIRLFGENLPPGEILAKPGTKGILPEVLSPGKYRLNPFAYIVQTFDAITIMPGFVGVQVSLVGEDPLNGKPKKVNTFIVENGEKGVVENTLDPGTYYINPYLFSIIPVNLQSNRFELDGDDAIDFLTMDGFTVRVEGTLEYAISRDKAALLTHEVGDLEDILQKVIIPRARGFARIEGSKGQALNYIVGEMRQEFQDKLFAHLKTQCGKWGVEIRSFLVRNITPPDEISSVIRERELAKQKAIMFGQQITQAKSKAELAKQEQLAIQNKEKVTADTTKLQAEILANQKAQVRLTAAEQSLSVAQLEMAAAEEQAAAITAKAKGGQAVVRATNEAEAAVLAQQAQAFNSGEEYARYLLLKKLAPSIDSVLTNDDPNGLGGIFGNFNNKSN